MIVTPLLQLAANKQASDLFFSVGAPVNIKIDGVTMQVNAQILDADVVKRIAYEMMSPKQIAAFETHLEMNFSFRAEGIGNFRVNVFRQRGDVAIVIRHIRARIEELPQILVVKIRERMFVVFPFLRVIGLELDVQAVVVSHPIFGVVNRQLAREARNRRGHAHL